MSMPATDDSAPKGFHVPVWVAAVVGVFVVAVGAFVAGRAVGGHRSRAFGARFGGAHVAHPVVAVLLALVLVGLLVAVVVVLIRHFWTPRTRPWISHPSNGAEEVLAQRFARGEIDETEYRARRDALRS